jgi:KDO2-lipid IV(A) lauroyltransferase
MKKFKHLLEAWLLHLLFSAFRLLPLDAASWLGGVMARGIGPFLSAHQIAKRNLAMVFPDWTPQKRCQTVRGMWDNLGRTAAELAHVQNDALFTRIRLQGLENFPAAGQQVLFFSGHFGNWELLTPTAFRHGVSITSIYRQANNPYVDHYILSLRETQATGMIPKGVRGAVKIARAIKSGHSLAMLIDQKLGSGISVPFLGHDAMTASAIAELALRYELPIVPARVLRNKGAHFEATMFPPLTYEKTGDHDQDVRAIMTMINDTLGTWVRDYPEQWFWVHKRWPQS